jgi:hypothetical protein
MGFVGPGSGDGSGMGTGVGGGFGSGSGSGCGGCGIGILHVFTQDGFPIGIGDCYVPCQSSEAAAANRPDEVGQFT